MDSKAPRSVRTSERVNIKVHYERVYWANELRITQCTLCKVVERVGPMVADIEKELQANRQYWDKMTAAGKPAVTRKERRSPDSPGALLRR